jgi:CRP/FNR family transcriptional regulator, cyclic AMP receptor protein
MSESARSESDERLRRSGREDHGFLSGLPARALEAFDAVKHVALYPRNSILFTHEREPRGIYKICSGRVKLSLSSRDGRILTLRLAKPGEVLGLAAVMLGNVSQVTAEALYPCEVEFVSRNDFMRILAMHESAFENVARELALQYEAACDQMRTVGLGLSVRDKFARFLLHWISEKQGPGNSEVVELPLNHEEIAACIGVTRESVTRAFRKFKSLGLVARQGYTWVIHRPALIRKFVISEASSPEFDSLIFHRRAVAHRQIRPARSGQLRHEPHRKTGLA